MSVVFPPTLFRFSLLYILVLGVRFTHPQCPALLLSSVVFSAVRNFCFSLKLIRCVETEAFVAVRENARMLEAILYLK